MIVDIPRARKFAEAYMSRGATALPHNRMRYSNGLIATNDEVRALAEGITISLTEVMEGFINHMGTPEDLIQGVRVMLQDKELPKVLIAPASWTPTHR